MSDGSEAQRPLEATGERLVPALQHGEVVHAEHLSRYLLAAQLAAGRRVLDAACGEGYGTALLAGAGARSATGVDVDDAVVAHASSRYPDADFIRGDVRELPFDDASFDLVACYETIEHVDEPERLLSELDRVLTADGLLLVSTPNKHQYLVENEYHRREFFHEEFVELLQACFARVEVMLQHNWLASAVVSVPLAGDESGERDLDLDFRKVVALEPGGELYTVALCGHGELPVVRGTAVASTVDEAHELARRAVEAERAAETWHTEYQRAERGLHAVYESVWWRATALPRRLVAIARQRRSG